MTTTAGQKAKAHFLKGYSCSESVLMALDEVWQLPYKVAPRAGSALGGGVGAIGEVCGAITGAAVALGLYRGRDDIEDEAGRLRKKKLYVTIQKLSDAFRKEFGQITCRKLINLDLSDQAQLEIYQEGEKRRQFCPKLVTFVADWMIKYLDY